MLIFKLALSAPLILAGCPEQYPFAFNDGEDCCFTGYDAANNAFSDNTSPTCNKENQIACNNADGCSNNDAGIAINTKDWVDDPSNIQCGGPCEDKLVDGVLRAQHCCLYLNATNSQGVVVENYWTCAVPQPVPVQTDPENPKIEKPDSRLSRRDRNILIGCIVGGLALLALILLLWWCCCRKKVKKTVTPPVTPPTPPKTKAVPIVGPIPSSSSSSSSSTTTVDIEKDVIILLDSSDSFNNKVRMTNGEMSENWAETTVWTKDMVSALANKETDYAVTIIQFSGVKKLEASYIPGSLGASGVEGVSHFKIEVEPTLLRDNKKNNVSTIHNKIDAIEALDGNGQLFLCLQDLTMGQFRNKLINTEGASIIIVSDDEWDIADLKTASGANATRNGIIDQIKKLYSVHMVCVRMHNEAGHDLSEGENYIKDEICNTARDSYHFVNTEVYESAMQKARNEILSKM